MAINLTLKKAVTIVELIIVMAASSVILLAAFSILISQFGYVAVFRIESELKGEAAYIIERMKKIVANSEHVNIIVGGASVDVYDRTGINVTGAFTVAAPNLTYTPAASGMPETISNKIGGLTFADARSITGNLTDITVLSVALRTRDPRYQSASNSNIITSMACRLAPNPVTVENIGDSHGINIRGNRFYRSIQAALNDAFFQANDEIRCVGRVSGFFDGIFLENVVISRSVILRGGFDRTFDAQTFNPNDPNAGTPSTIDGNGSPTNNRRVISCAANSVPNFTINGFIIQNGRMAGGGGGGINFYSWGAGATNVIITDNIVRNNTADNGAGINVGQKGPLSTLVIQNNQISGNQAGWDGGGISGDIWLSSNVTIANNLIAGNSGGRMGAGINIRTNETATNLTIANNIIRNNALMGGWPGGGINAGIGDASSCIIINNIIAGNAAPEGHGGGIFIDSYGTALAVIANNHIGEYGTATGYPGLSIYGTATGNTGQRGGGIRAVNNLTIANNTLFRNRTLGDSDSGGIFATTGNLTNITNNMVEENATDGVGGGISCFSLSQGGVISNCNVTNNIVNANIGGGISAASQTTSLESVVNIDNNTVRGNFGGGITLNSSIPASPLATLRVTNNTVTENIPLVATGSGGAGIFINNQGDGSTVAKNIISLNRTNGNGGGILVDLNRLRLDINNNIIAGNTAARFGGGISANGDLTGPVNLTNNTIVENSAGTNGGGIYTVTQAITAGPVNIINSISFGNINRDLFAGGTSQDTNVSFSDIGVSNGLINWDIPISFTNITDPPWFVNAAAGDYRLQDVVGNNDIIDGGNPIFTDISRPPGLRLPTSDMGAYGGPGATVTIGFLMPAADIPGTQWITENRIGFLAPAADDGATANIREDIIGTYTP
ncbi:MAG: right-handed parallel beta-helix repeat-containing protein [Candidatus Omnitrophota bacterium]|nr:right-handed parallel beta-helix repeat-containing protein [Candidatus Omnitrophota bacterium]